MVMHVLMFSSFWRVLSSSEWSDSNGLDRHSPPTTHTVLAVGHN